MYYYRPAHERGHEHHGWLNSHHTFSFAGYYDPKHMGISVLRVINDDVVSAGAGFDTHGHKDMEIISYVLEGSIEHKDSMGHTSVLREGEVQRMSAGTGVLHSEYNPSQTDRLRFLQIWVLPKQKGIEPSYEQRKIEQADTLTPLVTPTGAHGSLSINQDINLYRLRLGELETIDLDVQGKTGYLHVISGSAVIGEQKVSSGDGLGLLQENKITLIGDDGGLEALWFELPAH